MLLCIQQFTNRIHQGVHMLPIVLDPIETGMHIVLSRDAAKKHKAQKLRVGLVTHVARTRADEASEPTETFLVELLHPKKAECTCLTKKKHRINRTTNEHICTDELGENRHGHSRVDNPKILTLMRDDLWKMQEFIDE
jgi:hypothetical protein